MNKIINNQKKKKISKLILKINIISLLMKLLKQ